MKLVRSVVVFDAADLHAESAFWTGMLDGHVFDDEAFHSVIDAAGEWRIGVQLAPKHIKISNVASRRGSPKILHDGPHIPPKACRGTCKFASGILPSTSAAHRNLRQ